MTLEGGETVNVCGDAKYEEEGYTATDTYDGDLTDKLSYKIEDDSIILTVTDSSNNKAELKENLQLGDLVLFLNYETMKEIGHCGIYIGDGKFIHSSSGTGKCVKIDNLLPGNYYNTRYCGARRIIY